MLFNFIFLISSFFNLRKPKCKIAEEEQEEKNEAFQLRQKTSKKIQYFYIYI